MDKPFSKVLVANRGEIAVRIIRAARDLGIKTVAVYSDADRDALHVRLADEKYYIGPPDPRESYLRIDKIVEAAKETGAEAVHPGYGFLAQNPLLPERLEEEDIVFIGPPARIQKLVGDKLGARRFFDKHGVPVVPGSLSPIHVYDAVDLAEKLGYPVLIKPAGGGGGIGIFIAHSSNELKKLLRKAEELTGKAFGRSKVYIEKYYPMSKHIEVQILGDSHGNVIHIFERECSIQRRFQKVIEETPSPSLTEEEVKKVTSLALQAAKAMDYVNAGTIEFLFELNSRNFYLLEVNSRIQVEHPITEMVTGIDIVVEQFRIAAGEHIGFSQYEITRRGHSIEARIYAEDPRNNFIPSPGKIIELREPAGPWVRVDSGVYEGFEIPPHYDPLLMKIIVWGPNRETCINRLRRALMETRIKGVKTNLSLHMAVLLSKEFLDGTYTTAFLEKSGIIEKLPIEEEVVEERKVVKETGFRRGAPENVWRIMSRISSSDN